MNIAGKVALVTGSAVRVGRETAMELARAGTDVLIHYRSNAAQAETAAQAIRTLGRRCAIVQADFVRPAEACDRLVAAIDEQFAGRCEILVNNASAYTPGSPDSLPPQQWADLLAVNVTTPTMLAERLGERMAGGAGFQPAPASAQAEDLCHQIGGAIVNMLDIQARRPWKRYLACAMTAGAMWTATIGLARRFAPAVRVNGVAPGTVLWNEQDDDAMRQRVIELTPMKRIGSPADVAKAVRFLIESDYITGQVLCVDGGRSMC